jgi:tetratricopeptide (TPR) repeat protein
MRWIVTIGIAVGLLAGGWAEGARFLAWNFRETAEQAYYDGDLQGALANYEAVRKLLPGYPRSHMDYADSIAQALDGEPGRLMEAAELEEMAGRAMRSYLHAIRVAPPNANAYAGLGSLAGTLSNARIRREGLDLSDISSVPMDSLRPVDRLYEAALVKAVQIEPRNYYYRDFLGYFYLRYGFEERAIAHFREAARLQPVLDRHFYLKRLASISPAVLAAVEDGINEALNSGETEIRAEEIHRFLAEIYLRMGRLQDAKNHFEAVAAETDEPYIMHVRIGKILAEQGDDNGALEAFVRATELQPDYHGGWLHLGLALSRMDRHDEAVEALLQARGLQPTEYQPSWSLAIALENAGRLDEAAGVLEHVVRIHGDKRQAYDRLIRLYEKQARLSQAVRVARLLAERYPEEQILREQVEQLERAMGEGF